jgi:hypothetical protein
MATVSTSPIPGRCSRIVPSRPTSLSMPWVWLTVTPGSYTLPRACYITSSVTNLTLCYAPHVAHATPIDRLQRKLRPHGRAAIVAAYPPAPGQMGHDGQAAAAERRKRGARRVWPGDGAAVTDGDFEHVRVEDPSDPQVAVRQRMRVPQRVAQQFAHDQGRVVGRRLADACTAEFGGEATACHRDTGGRVREQNRARRPHLHQRPPCPAGISRSTRIWYERKCPAGPDRKPRDVDGVQMRCRTANDRLSVDEHPPARPETCIEVSETPCSAVRAR